MKKSKHISLPYYPDLEGKHVFISGGATGIGAELVNAYAENDCQVSFLDLDKVAGKKLVERLEKKANVKKNRRKIKFYHGDLTHIDALKKNLREVLESGTVDIIVNNAANDARHKIETLSEATWDKLLAVNLKSYFFVVQSLITPMKKQRQGVIINLSSNAGLLGLTGYPAYVSSKTGIIGLTRALARELGKYNIRVNGVLPGWVMTSKQKNFWADKKSVAECLKEQSLKILIEPMDIRGPVLYLSSEGARMITGQMLVVDAGRTFY